MVYIKEEMTFNDSENFKYEFKVEPSTTSSSDELIQDEIKYEGE